MSCFCIDVDTQLVTGYLVQHIVYSPKVYTPHKITLRHMNNCVNRRLDEYGRKWNN